MNYPSPRSGKEVYLRSMSFFITTIKELRRLKQGITIEKQPLINHNPGSGCGVCLSRISSPVTLPPSHQPVTRPQYYPNFS